MTQAEIQFLAQGLVDLKIEIKRLEEETDEVKSYLSGNGTDWVECRGGKVKFIDSGIRLNFKQDRLRQELENFGLDSTQIDTIINNSKEPTQRNETIFVYLD